MSIPRFCGWIAVGCIFFICYEIAASTQAGDSVDPTEKCYVISGLDLDDNVNQIQGWLELHGANTRISSSPADVFMLYIPPLSSPSTAQKIADQLKEYPEVRYVTLITKGKRKNGVSLGRYVGNIPQALLDRLRQLGLSAKILRLYSASDSPMLLIREAYRVDPQSFKKTFPSRHLLPVDCAAGINF